MRSARRLWFALLALLACGALAQSAGPDDACTQAMNRLCAGTDTAVCMRQRAAEPPAACRAPRPPMPTPAQRPKPGSAGDVGSGEGGCAADARRLCAPQENVKHSRAHCLRRHYGELSADCAQMHPDWRPPPDVAWPELARQWRAACPPQDDPLCAKADVSEAAWWSCVGKNWDKLPPPCRDFARSHDPWARKCAGDLEELCPGAQAQAATPCMLARKAELTGACRAFADGLAPAAPAAPARKPARKRTKKGPASRPSR